MVLDGELEPGAKMWCYCCEEELPKHVTDGSVSVEWGGLVEHLVKYVHLLSLKEKARQINCASVVTQTTVTFSGLSVWGGV